MSYEGSTISSARLGSGTANSTTFLRGDGTWVAAGVTDGDKGDITVSGSGATWTIDNGVVTLAKMADMATSSLIYRKTAGSGAPEVNTLATLKTDLGLTGTNSGDQTSIVGISGTKAQFDTACSDGNFAYADRAINTTAPLSGGGDLSADRTLTTSMNTGKLIGRTTAGTGIMEEVTPSTGLAMSALALTANLYIPARKSGLYYYPAWTVAGGNGAGATLSRLYAIPFWVGESQAFDRIAIALVTAVASAQLRVGLYADGGCVPGALIVDAGQIDCTSGFGIKTATINQTLSGLVWIAAVWQGAVATSYVRLGQSIVPFIGTSSPYSSWPGMAYSQNSVTGGLPSPWGSTYNLEATANTIPAVSLRKT